jgi:hypothetical protein
LIGLVDTLERLAALRPADACTLRREALERWQGHPGNTAYLRDRASELAKSVAMCPAR